MKCIRMLTFLPLEEIEKMSSWEGAKLNDAKEILAYELTKLVHSEEDADKSQTASKALFEDGSDDSSMPTTEISADKLTDGSINIVDLMLECGLVPSKSEARRLINQGGVHVNDESIDDINAQITKELLEDKVIIRKGKKTYHKAIIK